MKNCTTFGIIGLFAAIMASGQDATISTAHIPSTIDGALKPQNWIVESENLAYRNLNPIAKTSGAKRFERITAKESGLDFINELSFDAMIKHHYLINGAGLAVGDYDGDGLPDVFMAGQESGSRLFRQTTPWTFTDATEDAGLPLEDGFASGAAFADMDNDGDLDLLVCYRGSPNRYYINLGNGTFKSSTFSFEPDNRSGTTMISVMDADSDGDLDAYLVCNRLDRWQDIHGNHLRVIKDDDGNLWPAKGYEEDVMFVNGKYQIELGRRDYLMMNTGTPADTALQYGIADESHGLILDWALGLAANWCDFNNDQMPDLYVSNDFEMGDHLYINSGHGLKEMTGQLLSAVSLYSMGADCGDLNNDGWMDLISTDMANTTHYKSKISMGDMDSKGWLLDLSEPRQAMRNFVHINTGTGRFLETARFSHMASSDWTFSVLCGDLDLDGREDVFYSNGLLRNVNDSDLNNEFKLMEEAGGSHQDVVELFRKQPELKERNLCYRNEGNLEFEECADEWGLGLVGISHGSVMADLDRDGDLDLIVNNQNAETALYRNTTADGGRLLVSLQGQTSNSHGLGARLVLKAGDLVQTRFITSARGYASGTEAIAQFGLGDASKIDALTIYWPGGKVQQFHDLAINRHYRITESETKGMAPVLPTYKPLFTQVAAADVGLDFLHVENEFNDFDIQPLLPNQISKMGPALATGDVDGDGRLDIYIGGAHQHAGALYVQESTGKYQHLPVPLFEKDAGFEDTGAVFFDADGDKDLDLYVVSGGNYLTQGNKAYQDRLYINQGDGVWVKADLPALRASGKAVAACDFDQDGDQDLFVGGRIVPQCYPENPGSILLVNEKGSFTCVTNGFADSGMITDARWADIDGDGWQDLLATVEWGSIRLWHNEEGKLVDATQNSGIAEDLGWWMSLETGDFDNDGDIDFFAGNWGLNTKYKASTDKPVNIYAGDFGDGKFHIVESCTKQGKVVPVRGLSCSSSAMPFIKDRFPTYHAFASASLDELYTPDVLSQTTKLEVNTLASAIYLNDGKGHFIRHEAPSLAQLAPIMSINVDDVDNDGVLDCLLGQNFYLPQRETGRDNGGLCLLLKGKGDGTFEQQWPAQSGISVRADVRYSTMLDVNGDGRRDWLVMPNSGQPQVLVRLPESVGKVALSD